MTQINELGVGLIDIVAINLYPFKQTIKKDNVTFEEAIENIDIGGPTMLRAAAKNWQDVAVIADPKDYTKVLDELNNGGLKKDTKLSLAAKVFEHTAHYDALIAKYLNQNSTLDKYSDYLTLTYEKCHTLRYGENPHQKAMFYKEPLDVKGALTMAEQLHGKKLSFNNINDTNGALDILREFKTRPTVVAVKHANPCGVGSASDIHTAYKKAYDCDPVSIFGGIVVANREIDEKTAEEINKIFIEIVVAPNYSDKALEVLKSKKNIRLLRLESINETLPKSTWDTKKVAGGLLVQEIDNKLFDDDETLEVVTERKPTEKEMEDLIFTWKVVKHTKSNGIAIGKNLASIGVGPGQVNRIWATESSIERAGDNAKGAVLASDAFFPFADCVEAAAKAGITAIIQPGGSRNDKLSIDACNEHGIAMIFTKMRHFKH